MNYTKDYHLPQWEETDRIMRTDFNQAMSGIETGLAENREAAEEAAKLPYVTGTYVGTDQYIRHIVLGFRPSFVFVGTQLERTSTSGIEVYTAFTCGGVLPNRLKITDDGFTINGNPDAIMPNLNYMGRTYDYIAFR